MFKRLVLIAPMMITGCKSTAPKASEVKSTETLEQVRVTQDSVQMLARCGSPTTKCERGNKWRTVGIRYIARGMQSAAGIDREMDHYFISVYVAEQSSKMFGKLSEINLGNIEQDAGLWAYQSYVFAPIVGRDDRLIYIGKLDDNDNLALEPGIAITPAVNDVRQNLWERYWEGLSDQRIPFLYLTYDKNKKYAVATSAMIRDNQPPK